MSETLTVIANVAILTFVLSSMVALGLSLTFKQAFRDDLSSLQRPLFRTPPDEPHFR
jgi:hypothetical protein